MTKFPCSVFLMITKGLYRTIVCRCLIHRPHYSARLMGFGSRGPSEFFFFSDTPRKCLERDSLRSKRFQSSYCAKVRAEAKKVIHFFFCSLFQLSRRTSRGNACYAGYERDCLGRRRTGTRYGPRGGGVLPYMGYIGMCRCEGYGFQAVYSRIGYINQSVWL